MDKYKSLPSPVVIRKKRASSDDSIRLNGLKHINTLSLHLLSGMLLVSRFGLVEKDVF